MKSIFRSFATLILLGLLIFTSSCKKETTTPDDPNIVHVTLNKTTTTVLGSFQVDSVDLNRDGLYEIAYKLLNQGADSGYIIAGTRSQFIEFAIDGVPANPYVKLFTSGSVAPTGNSAYIGGFAFSIKTGGYRLGILDNADKYLVFRFSTGTKFNYGWMKVNLNSAYTEFKIIEYAYSILPDTPIAVGAQ